MAERLSTEELKGRLLSAQIAVTARGLYTHDKTKKSYVVWGHALREEDLEPLVLYEAEGVVFARPVDEFLRKFTRWGARPEKDDQG